MVLRGLCIVRPSISVVHHAGMASELCLSSAGNAPQPGKPSADVAKLYERYARTCDIPNFHVGILLQWKPDPRHKAPGGGEVKSRHLASLLRKLAGRLEVALVTHNMIDKNNPTSLSVGLTELGWRNLQAKLPHRVDGWVYSASKSRAQPWQPWFPVGGPEGMRISLPFGDVKTASFERRGPP